MSKDTQTLIDAPAFSCEVEKIIASKNPITILFGLAKLRGAFEDITNDLLSGIEKTYYEEKAADFGRLVNLYEKNGFYQIIGNYYIERGIYQKQKQLLDSYFSESYWRDIDFFFYVIGKFSDFKQVFSVVHYFYQNNEILKRYLSSKDIEKDTIINQALTTLREEKNASLKKYTIAPTKENILDAKFLRSHVDFLSILTDSFLSKEKIVARNLSRANSVVFIRDLYIFCISNEHIEHINYFKENLIENIDLQSVLIENLTDLQIGECYSYLRKKLLKTPKYNLELNTQNVYFQYVQLMIRKTSASIEEKLAILRSIQDTYGNYGPKRETFQNIIRKGLMYRGSLDMVDSALGITFLTRTVFYQAKKKLMGVNMDEFQFEGLIQAGKLVDMLDSSIILHFVRPFFIWRLARTFSKQKSDIYYFIKFILTIHGSSTYGEYQKLSRLFVSLEAFEKKGLYGTILVASQFGWIFITLLLLYLFAPLGVFLSVIGIGILHFIRRTIGQKLPELSLVSNFQTTAYVVIFGLIFAILGVTIGLQDNTRIVYGNFQKTINALILTSSESIDILTNELNLKASIYGKDSGGERGESKLEQINYIKGINYTDIK